MVFSFKKTSSLVAFFGGQKPEQSGVHKTLTVLWNGELGEVTPLLILQE
jgi:hypothetical protein